MAWWLMPRTPDPEAGGSSPTRVKQCCVLEQGTFTPQKVLIIPRKRWLRPNMTEKLFTGTLRINQPTNQQTKVLIRLHVSLLLTYAKSRFSHAMSIQHSIFIITSGNGLKEHLNRDHMSPVTTKPAFGVSDQVPHKPREWLEA